jgi:hypothetical protein
VAGLGLDVGGQRLDVGGRFVGGGGGAARLRAVDGFLQQRDDGVAFGHRRAHRRKRAVTEDRPVLGRVQRAPAGDGVAAVGVEPGDDGGEIGRRARGAKRPGMGCRWGHRDVL